MQGLNPESRVSVMASFRVLEIKQSVFEDNTQQAAAIRAELKQRKTFLLNLMSSPGSGKTTTVVRTIEALKADMQIGVIEADIDSDVDAVTISHTGARVVQLHTGGMCHMDALMTRQGLAVFGDAALDLVILQPFLIFIRFAFMNELAFRLEGSEFAHQASGMFSSFRSRQNNNPSSARLLEGVMNDDDDDDINKGGDNDGVAPPVVASVVRRRTSTMTPGAVEPEELPMAPPPPKAVASIFSSFSRKRGLGDLNVDEEGGVRAVEKKNDELSASNKRGQSDAFVHKVGEGGELPPSVRRPPQEAGVEDRKRVARPAPPPPTEEASQKEETPDALTLV